MVYIIFGGESVFLRLVLGVIFYSNRGLDLEMFLDVYMDVFLFVGFLFLIWVFVISDLGMVGLVVGGEGVGWRDSSRVMVLL